MIVVTATVVEYSTINLNHYFNNCSSLLSQLKINTGLSNETVDRT